MTNKSRSTAIFVVVLFAALLIVVMLFINTSEDDFSTRPTPFAQLGGNFTLTAANGDVALSDFRGKAVVMYFGFLSCPEVCPNSMSVIQSAFNRLSDTERASTQAILVSVDPNRDTPGKLADYAEFFHPNLVGVTGTRSQLDQVTRQYGAYYDFADIERAGDDYAVEHSSRYYVMNPQGKLVAAMRHSTTPNELTAQLREVLSPAL